MGRILLALLPKHRVWRCALAYCMQSQYLRAIQAYGQVPAEQLTDQDRIRWAEALERTGQYPRAEQLLANCRTSRFCAS